MRLKLEQNLTRQTLKSIATYPAFIVACGVTCVSKGLAKHPPTHTHTHLP